MHSRIRSARTYHFYITTQKGRQCFHQTFLYANPIRADRFLRNMVRAIVGTLIEVGRGKLSVEGFRRIIEQKDRGKAGTSVPGNALFLVNVEYPASIFASGES